MADRTDGDWTRAGASRAAPPASQTGWVPVEEPLRITEYDHPRLGLRVVGVVDLNSHKLWAQILRQATSRSAEVHLDLADLGFIDVRGVTVLVDIASRLNGGRRIVIHHAPFCLRRVMQVLWPEGVAAITIEGGRNDPGAYP